MKKKKYHFHPFKMHGSYIGLILGFLCSYFILVALFVVGKFSELKPTSFLIIFIPLVAGFLLGWGLHSLIKFVRK